jgi:hypothetical protein
MFPRYTLCSKNVQIFIKPIKKSGFKENAKKCSRVNLFKKTGLNSDWPLGESRLVFDMLYEQWLDVDLSKEKFITTDKTKSRRENKIVQLG